MAVPPAVRDTRRATGLTQAQLASRAEMSQSRVSQFESGDIDCVSVGEAGRLLDVLGIRTEVAFVRPYVVSGPRQRDAAHARCVAYAAGRLRAMGFDVRLEVEIHGDRSHGWIDVLAYHAGLQTMFVAEIKTELVDLGAVQRQVAWYARSADAVGRSFGWRINAKVSALLVLATDANETRLTENRHLLREAFPTRAAHLFDWLEAPTSDPLAPALALIDPAARRRRWLIATSLDGRRSQLRYANYRDFILRAQQPKVPR